MPSAACARVSSSSSAGSSLTTSISFNREPSRTTEVFASFGQACTAARQASDPAVLLLRLHVPLPRRREHRPVGVARRCPACPPQQPMGARPGRLRSREPSRSACAVSDPNTGASRVPRLCLRRMVWRCDQIRTWRKLSGRLGQKQGDRQLRCSEQYAFPLVSAIAILVKAPSSNHKQKNIAPCAFRRTAQPYFKFCATRCRECDSN